MKQIRLPNSPPEMEKGAAAAALRELIFHSCDNVWFCHAFKKIFAFFVQFLAFLQIFARF